MNGRQRRYRSVFRRTGWSREGTLSLKKETFLAVVFDFASLRTHGLTRITCVESSTAGMCAAAGESVPGFSSRARHSDRGQLPIGTHLHPGDRQKIHAKWQSTRPCGGIRNVVCDGGLSSTCALDSAVGLRANQAAVAHQRIPASAAQEEEFAREAKLATTAKGEAMIGIAVRWGPAAARLIQRRDGPTRAVPGTRSVARKILPRNETFATVPK